LQNNNRGKDNNYSEAAQILKSFGPNNIMNKKAVAALVSLVLILLAGYGLFRLSKSRTFQFFGGLTDRVRTEQKVAALTFDDGPSEYSDEVVDILAEKNAKATFYLIGQNIEEYPDQVKNIIERGNEIGNHSYSHPTFIFRPFLFVDAEIAKTNDLIRGAGYRGEITFRPPGGKKLIVLPWYLQQHKIKTIMWNVEPDTYVAGNAEAIVSYTLENTKPGSIILLHPFCKTQCEADREALPKIIDGLRSQGYTFVTIEDLLSYSTN
jgi:chitin deacetylase